MPGDRRRGGSAASFLSLLFELSLWKTRCLMGIWVLKLDMLGNVVGNGVGVVDEW